MRNCILFAALLGAACSSDPAAPAEARAHERAAPAPEAVPVASTEPAPAPAPASEPGTPPAADPVGEFDAQAQALYRIAACGGDAPVPARFTKVVEEHCKRLTKLNQRYRDGWLTRARAYLETLVPTDVPDRVLYPFGGQDLTSALAAFPNAREITIISLETASDPRTIDRLPADELEQSLQRSREHLRFLADVAFHRTEDLKEMGEDPLPEQIVGALWSLAVHDRQPVSLRFFTVADDGEVQYVTDRYEHFELTFRAAGGPLQTYRHIATNLRNDGLRKTPGMVAYIQQRAPFAGVIKAASFLLWMKGFSTIRDLMLEHAVFIVADSTAPLPTHARAAGWDLTPYGKFAGVEVAFKAEDYPQAEEMVELWATRGQGEVPMRWGYLDIKRKRHLLVMKKGQKAAATSTRD